MTSSSWSKHGSFLPQIPRRKRDDARSDILLIIGLLRSHAAPGSKAADLFTDWFDTYDEMPSGGSDLKLVDHLEDPIVAQEMVAALDASRRKIQNFSKVIPGTYVDEVLEADEEYPYKDRSVAEIDEKLTRLQAFML